MVRNSIFETLVSFCIGASWVLALALAALAFSYALFLGTLKAAIFALFGLLIGFVFVAFFEGINLLLENHKEQKKQTELLAELLGQSCDAKLSDH